jgi:uncharacterized protein YjeT (DUF2065 family)
MKFLIFLGLYFIVMGVLMILFPHILKKKLGYLLSWKTYKPLGAAAALIGLVLFFVSGSSKLGLFVVLIGILSLAKGLFFLFAAHDKAKFLINWSVSLADDSYRLWGIISFAVGMLFLFSTI